MYSSSSSQKSATSSGLIRYGSAPGSFLTTAVDSVIGADRDCSAIGSQSTAGHYFSGDSASLTSESACKVNSSSVDPKEPSAGGLQRSYDFNNNVGVREFVAAANMKSGGGSSSLVRQRSSPAGFGFSVTRGIGNYNSHGNGGPGVSRLSSQLSFTSQDSLSQISKVNENIVDGVSSSNGHQNAMHSYATANFGMDSWDNTNSIVFSPPPSKRTKNADGEYFSCFNGLESQYSMPQTSLEMATLDKLLNIPEDSVPCKIRAKRGCATHPRSIAERERRTRISGKLKKLQDLVPNMDKQTSYADMLDLAVQHIKGLQNQVQKLHTELEHCTCGCKPTS